MSTLSSANFTEGNILLKERIQTNDQRQNTTELPISAQRKLTLGSLESS